MRIWLACFFVLFALAELFDWMQQLTLPMPIYILGGAFLAIASNYNKRFGSFFANPSTESASFINSNYSPTRSISYTGDHTEQHRLNEKEGHALNKCEIASNVIPEPRASC